MEFYLPELGEGVYEAEMSRWLVKTGDTVKPGQGLLEVLTDKAAMEVPAPFAGTIESFKIKEGQKVKVGDVVLVFQGEAEPEKPATPPASSAPAVKTAAPGNGASVKAAPS